VTASTIVVPGATMALTRRTTLRKAFLAPWNPLVEQCWLYSLAGAQHATGIAVHHSVLNVSHHHTNVTPRDTNLPDFKRRFHRDLSCSLHTLLCRHRYDAPREIFDDRPTHTMRLLDAESQARHLVYERVNPVAAGLVAHPSHMPMGQLDFGLWRRGYVEVERPPVYFGADRPDGLRLLLTPPPLLYDAFGGDIDAIIYHLTKLTDEAVQRIRRSSAREPLGARALRRMHPWSEPRTLRESGGERVPSFRVGVAGPEGVQQAIAAALDVRRFRRESRAAFLARRSGEASFRFPFGTYAAREHHGAPVEPAPHLDAVVTRPGPVLQDSARSATSVARAGFVDDVRALVDADVVELCSHIDQAPVVDDEQGESESVMHRFEKRSTTVEHIERIVVLRDRCRGRPPSPAHGNEPPA
jgi:hypothetical protein